MVVSETIAWMEQTLKETQASNDQGKTEFIYPQREAAILIALIGTIGIALLTYFPVAGMIQTETSTPLFKDQDTKRDWRFYAIWGILNLILFVPMFGFGAIVSFPPLIFGSSIAWWMLVTGLLGLLILKMFPKKNTGKKTKIKEAITRIFSANDLFATLVPFTVIFMLTITLSLALSFNFRIISPVFRAFSSIDRFLTFFAFIPFFLPYFVAEGRYLHELNNALEKHGISIVFLNYCKAIFGKTVPFLILILLQYLTKVAFGIWLLPSFVGFLIEFLWLIVPIFLITTSFSFWFHNKTWRTAPGALFNALLMSWVASAVFPL
jgi:hypothetical protein